MHTTSLVTLREHLAEAAARLQRAGLPAVDAAFDAELLARTVLTWDRATILTRMDEAAPDGFARQYNDLVTRRERREPAAQVVGIREFWGRPFEVTRDVLVPRPETELIVEEALRLFPRGCRSTGAGVRLVDVGTGSGCLAVSLAREWPHAEVTATDISEAALRVARRNAERHGAGRIRFVHTSLVDGLTGRFDLVVANPPYVQSGARSALSPEVREYEPAEALFGGEDGMAVIRSLLDRLPDVLAADGFALMEFGAGQDDRVSELVAERQRLHLNAFRDDLQGIPRMMVLSGRP